MTQDIIEVGVVGIGKMGLLHASLLSTLPDVRVIGFCDNNEMIVKYLRKIKDSMDVFTKIDELCDRHPDVIYVTTPIPTHFEIIKFILSTNQNSSIFTEKTLTDNFADSEQLASLVRARKNPMMVGYHKRYSKTFRKAIGMLKDEGLGGIDSFQAYAYSEDFLNAKTNSLSQRGGLLKDLGSHSIDLAMSFFGHLEFESLVGNAKSKEFDPNSISFRVRTATGFNGLFDISWSAPGYHKPEVGISIIGEKGVLFVNEDKLSLKTKDGQELKWSRHTLDDNVPFLLAEPEYYREDEEFIESIRSGEPSTSDFESALKVDYVISKVQSEIAFRQRF